MNRFALLFISSTLTAICGTSAFAGNVDRDIHRVQQDKARLHNDYRALREERSEVRAAEARERNAIRHGNWWQAWRAERWERHEARDVRAIENRIAHDRARLAHDRAVLRRDVYGY